MIYYIDSIELLSNVIADRKIDSLIFDKQKIDDFCLLDVCL